MPERRLQLSDVQVYVDPLDATQEYTGFEIFWKALNFWNSENLTQYVTVMTCVTHGDEPIFGAIYRPFFDETSKRWI